MRRTAEALFTAQMHRARLVTGVTFLLALLYAAGPASAAGEQICALSRGCVREHGRLHFSAQVCSQGR
jgi:hypothetical protein